LWDPAHQVNESTESPLLEQGAKLEEWALGGFVDLMGRIPQPEDYIVPHVSRRNHRGHHTRSTYYKAFIRGCEAAGIRARSLHSMRHTMVTMARRGGANKFELSKVTHNAAGDIIDRYTHAEWDGLCEAVLCIGQLFGARPSPRLLGNDPQDIDGEIDSTGARKLADSSNGVTGRRLQLPAPPLINQPRTTERQSSRQSDSVSRGALTHPAAWSLLLSYEHALTRARVPSGDLFGSVRVLEGAT